MLDNIIDKNIIFLQNHGVKMNSDDDRAIYKYGLQILYYYVIDLIVIFSLASIFGRLYETVIMTFIFGLFQIFNGGYHAKTPARCLLTMVVGVVVGNIFIMLFANKFMFNTILTVVFGIIIFVSKPVVNKKHLVDKKVIQRSKMIFKAVMILILVAIMIFGYFNKNVEVATIAVTLGLYLLSWGIADKAINNKKLMLSMYR